MHSPVELVVRDAGIGVDSSTETRMSLGSPTSFDLGSDRLELDRGRGRGAGSRKRGWRNYHAPLICLRLALAPGLGSAAANSARQTALCWRVAGTLRSTTSTFFVELPTTLADGTRAWSLAPGARAPALFGTTGGTNLGIFPDNGGRPERPDGAPSPTANAGDLSVAVLKKDTHRSSARAIGDKRPLAM